jgi:hypothetical protein
MQPDLRIQSIDSPDDHLENIEKDILLDALEKTRLKKLGLNDE